MWTSIPTYEKFIQIAESITSEDIPWVSQTTLEKINWILEKNSPLEKIIELKSLKTYFESTTWEISEVAMILISEVEERDRLVKENEKVRNFDAWRYKK